ncbi:hypothetical protein PVA19_01770 [Agrobacterium sp. CNPSo 3708]|nr:hypothetical protein [Agrobacterium sp. CNPSo 3708]MDD1497124.1 hypothetical protein [Agrobacterium sp. CNPSo 3708]
MALPDKDMRGGLKDQVLAGKYVLGALPEDVKAELAERVRKDQQFATIVRRWEDNLAETEVRE